MMVGKDDDLGLSLSLGCSTTGTSHTNAANRAASNTNPSSSYQIPTASPLPFHLNLMMPSTSSAVPTAAAPISYSLPHHNPFSSAASAAVPPHKTTTMTSTPSWTLDGSNPFNLFSADRSSDATRAATTNTTTDQHQRSFLKGIDVNRLPSSNNNSPADEEEAGVSSPNSTLSSVGGKRCEREPAVAAVSTGSGDDERNSSRGGVGSDDEDGDTSRKKLRLSKDQSAVLEDSFKEHNTLNPKQKLALAKRLGLRPRQVEVWFQNRRARTKLKQTEVDCEFLRRCCEQLTDENRRLQKEVQELRALKLSPQFYMQMTPPTTLTMCPSCERVGGGGGSAAAITPTHPAAPLHGSSTSTAVGSNKTSSDASRQSVPPAQIQHLPNHHRTMNPWGVTVAAHSPVPIRSIESLQPRS